MVNLLLTPVVNRALRASRAQEHIFVRSSAARAPRIGSGAQSRLPNAGAFGNSCSLCAQAPRGLLASARARSCACRTLARSEIHVHRPRVGVYHTCVSRGKNRLTRPPIWRHVHSGSLGFRRVQAQSSPPREIPGAPCDTATPPLFRQRYQDAGGFQERLRVTTIMPRAFRPFLTGHVANRVWTNHGLCRRHPHRIVYATERSLCRSGVVRQPLLTLSAPRPSRPQLKPAAPRVRALRRYF